MFIKKLIVIMLVALGVALGGGYLYENWHFIKNPWLSKASNRFVSLDSQNVGSAKLLFKSKLFSTGNKRYHNLTTQTALDRMIFIINWYRFGRFESRAPINMMVKYDNLKLVQKRVDGNSEYIRNIMKSIDLITHGLNYDDLRKIKRITSDGDGHVVETNSVYMKGRTEKHSYDSDANLKMVEVYENNSLLHTIKLKLSILDSGENVIEKIVLTKHKAAAVMTWEVQYGNKEGIVYPDRLLISQNGRPADEIVIEMTSFELHESKLSKLITSISLKLGKILFKSAALINSKESTDDRNGDGQPDVWTKKHMGTVYSSTYDFDYDGDKDIVLFWDRQAHLIETHSLPDRSQTTLSKSYYKNHKQVDIDGVKVMRSMVDIDKTYGERDASGQYDPSHIYTKDYKFLQIDTYDRDTGRLKRVRKYDEQMNHIKAPPRSESQKLEDERKSDKLKKQLREVFGEMFESASIKELDSKPPTDNTMLENQRTMNRLLIEKAEKKQIDEGYNGARSSDG